MRGYRVGEGYVIDNFNIVTKYGIEYRFESDLPNGTSIFIFYDYNLNVVEIEAKTSEISPENQPKFRPGIDDGGHGDVENGDGG